MKKFFAIVVAAALCVSMASCSFMKKNDTDASTGAASSAVESQQTELEKLVNDESVQKQLEPVVQQAEAQGMKATVEAEGNSLVYTFQFNSDQYKDVTAEQVEKMMAEEEFASTYTNLLKQFKLIVPDTESIVVRYLDLDGNELASEEYK